MRKTSCVLVAAALALTATWTARADEKADARAIIDKAIKAMGGAEKVGDKKAQTFKFKGKSFAQGEGVEFTGDWAIQPPDKVRFQINLDINGMKITLTQVFNGKEGWTKLNDQTIDYDKDAVEEAKEQLYAGGVESLAPLVKEKGFELSVVGDVKVNDQPAVEVLVASKGHRDVHLFFDKKTNMLVKTQRTIKDQMQGGKEVNEETFRSDFKDFGGAQRATKIVIKRDGKDYVEGEASDYETIDKLDDSVFGKP
jgi:hypothetical protein